MSGLGRQLHSAGSIGVTFLVCAVLSVGCGNPEAPKIENVRLSYWNSLTGDGNWVSLENGATAPQSPVRIQGTITDNTAVVTPRITWIGDRGIDAEDAGFIECSDGTSAFYECVMDCEEAPGGGFFECNPLLPASTLIRGDLYLLTMKTTAQETFEVEVQVSEAQDLVVPEAEDDPILVVGDYRILRLDSLKGDPNPFLWSLVQRKVAGGQWVPLRSGDILNLGSGDSGFQLGVQVPEGMELEAPPEATWQSLVKWNNQSSLDWDAKTGSFKEEFQLFDPRLRDPSGAVIAEEGAPAYRFVASAQDVPDQKTGEFRSSATERDLLFLPESVTMAPDLEVDGEDEGWIQTSDPGDNVGGTVRSFSGEVRSLLYRLSEEPPASCGSSENPEGQEGPVTRPYYLNPESISLTGDFIAAVIYVSDWNGDGVVDEEQGEEGIPNYLEVVALGVEGNEARTCVTIGFTVPTKTDRSPELELQEIFPAVDKDGQGLLPYGEQMRLRARAADDRGQPAFSVLKCLCEADEPPINGELCSCGPLTGETEAPWVSLNAGGAYPWDPWDWIRVTPPSDAPRKTIAVLRAKEKVEDPKDLPVAKFTSLEIPLEPESESEAYSFEVGLTETQGPTVTLLNWKNGDLVVNPDSFIVQARIIPHYSELNRITALWNGQPRANPSYDSTTGTFLWDLQGFTVREGDKICVGAVSVDEHATLYLLEFANTEQGLLLGVTLTPDQSVCN